jgi:eukaryotic-like serine/threonine-protein kinase
VGGLTSPEQLSKSDHSTERTDEDEREPSGRVPQAGERIGKYFVLETIGEGAMGVVVRAYDPDLERAIAIKVVQPHLTQAERSEAARARLIVEARAQARISHPNVVAIYEVGEHDGLVYVAMELVEGVDLQRWLKQSRRPWREVVDAFVAAGRGLAQVHLAGLVHRDVKPANIMVGTDGRVRVGDFGIARASFELPSPLGDGAELGDAFDLETTALTADGRVVGTPAYMAPEQHVEAAVGPESDQYAFCVSLYEALWGVRPFAVDVRRLLAAKLAGPVEPPRTRAVPRWLFAVVARGLDPDPARRFADMTRLTKALLRDPGAQRRRTAIAGTLAIGIGGAIAIVATRPGPCDERSDPLADVWDAEQRDAVEAVFAASDRPWAAEAWAHAGPSLDAYARDWSAMRRDACEATHVRGDQTAELLDRRAVCLEGRRRALAATTALFAAGGHEAIDHAFDLVGHLRPLAPCADAVALASAIELPDDAALREAVEAVRVDLAHARVLVDAGRHREAAEIAHSSTTTARELGYPPLVAEALAFEGETLVRVGRADDARLALEESLWTAIGVGHDEAAVDAASTLVWVAGQHDRALAEAQRWGELAMASIRRSHSTNEHELVLLENALGASLINASKYDEGLATFERALARIADDPTLTAKAGTIRHNIALQWMDRGEFGRAREVLEPTIAELEPILGRDHPRLVSMRGTLAQVLGSVGDHERAVALFREEADGLALVFGEDAIQVAYARSNLGVELAAIGRSDEFIAITEEALATFERLHDWTGAATSLGNLGGEYLDKGAYDAAAARYERALEALGHAYPDGHHPDLAHPLVGLGRVRMAEGRFADALATFERADRIVRESQSPSTRIRGQALGGESDALVALRRLDDALAAAREQVEVIRAAGDVGPTDLPTALRRHAHVLCELGRFAEALEQADAAVALLAERPPDGVAAGLQLERARALAGLERRSESREAAAAAIAAAERVVPRDLALVADTNAAVAALSKGD